MPPEKAEGSSFLIFWTGIIWGAAQAKCAEQLLVCFPLAYTVQLQILLCSWKGVCSDDAMKKREHFLYHNMDFSSMCLHFKICFQIIQYAIHASKINLWSGLAQERI